MDQELVRVSFFAGPCFIFSFSLLFFLLLRFRNGDEEEDQSRAGKQKPSRGLYRTFVFSSEGNTNSNQTTMRGNVLFRVLRFRSNSRKNNVITVPTWRNLSPPPTPVCSRGTRAGRLLFAELRAYVPIVKDSLASSFEVGIN